MDVGFLAAERTIRRADTWLQEAENHMHPLFVSPFGCRGEGKVEHCSIFLFLMAKSQADIGSLSDEIIIETLEGEAGIPASRAREWQERINRIRSAEVYTEASRLLLSRSRGRDDHSTGRHF